jgi:hypothetical protein
LSSLSPDLCHDITPAGKRFLIRGRTQYTVVAHLNFVFNWFEEFKRLVPSDKR